MSTFIVLTRIDTHPHVETALRPELVAQATPHFEVDRPHAEPKLVGTAVKLATGETILVSESVSEILTRLEYADAVDRPTYPLPAVSDG